MAELIELNDDDSTNQPLTGSDNQDPPQDNLDQAQQEPVIPEKYKGKTVEEIIRMHQEAEKLIGRQAQEVGEVRKLADELIRQQLEAKKENAPVPQETQEIDFFDDPKKAVDKAVENNPLVKQLQEQIARQKQLEALAKIEKAHPDFMSIAESSEFQQWKDESPVRKKLYDEADNYNADAAIELLTTFKALKGIKEKTIQAADESVKNVGDQQRKEALRAASMPTNVSTGESSKPTYRYADIMRMMTYDRERYNQMADEILLAYQEGRVKGRPN